jgi:hypothetical protein
MSYDVFFLAYGEPNAEANWARLCDIVPTAKRVDDVPGILTAHQACARRSNTPYLFVVDADNAMDDDFDFRFRVAPEDHEAVHLWFARNPVNGLEYGWGGLKLFPRDALLAREDFLIDMTTSFPLKVIPEIVSTSLFNTSRYAAWRSGFREAVKLSLAKFRDSDPLTDARLEGWLTKGAAAPFGEWAITGAKEGLAYGEAKQDSVHDLHLINDYAWLRGHFVERHGEADE